MHRRTFLKGSSLLLTGIATLEVRHAVGQFVPATGPLKVDSRNPRYFTDGSGRAIFLTGSHTWANFQESGTAPVRTFDWEGYLSMMQSHNHNFMRLWAWQQSAWGPWTPDKIVFEPTLYVRSGPGSALDGGLKFDLKKFNPAYFALLRARISECRDRGIYCAVQLFQGFSVNKPDACGDQTWSGHPYNALNNINRVDGDKNADKVLDYDDPSIRSLHAAYLQKVVDTINDLNNVLYEVINEGGNKEWDWWVVGTVHKLESEKRQRHPVGLTGGGHETMDEMLASPADWISPFGSKFRDPPVWDGRKVSVNDTDHLWGHGGTAAWAWKSFVRGHNTLLMDAWVPVAGAPCPEAGVVNWGPRAGYPLRNLNRRDDPVWEPVRRALGHTRYYADRMDLASMTPSANLASTGYCLANPEREFLVYLPEGDSVTVDVSKVSGSLSAEWMHPVEGTIIPGGSVNGGKSLQFYAPLIGPAVLYLRRKSA
jgi:hypothetical protein